MRCRWIVSDVCTIETNCLSVKEVGQSLVCGGRVAQTTGGNVNAAKKVIPQTPVYSEASPHTRAITVWHALLEVILATNPHITREAESAECRFQGRESLLLVLLRPDAVCHSGFDVRHVARQFRHSALLLISGGLHRSSFLLSLGS